MSSIDEQTLLARTLYRDEVLPLASRFRNQGEEFFPFKPDPNKERYFEIPLRPVMTREDFAFPFENPGDFARRLKELWRAEGRSELSELAEAIGKLAEALEESPLVESDEVSPFVYTMF